MEVRDPHLDVHELYELKLLEHVEKTPRLNNREAARILGVSVKLSHDILTRMVRKGLFHITKHHARRWDYFLTPSGITEKARLTLEFVDFSMQFYREARRRSAQLCKDLSLAGRRRVAFIGAGDLAEIAYLGVREWGLDLVAVYAEPPAPAKFMQVPVQPLAGIAGRDCDALVVCVYDARLPMAAQYLPPGLVPSPDMCWVFAPPPTLASA